MAAFLTSALFAFTTIPTFALPVANGTNIDVNGFGLENPFVQEPRGRGTISLIWSCLATFGLCIWTAIHPNVIPDSTVWSRLFYKLYWALCAALLPEFILMCAFGQFRKAWKIRALWKEKTGNNSLGLAGGFFVLMGGLTVEGPDGYTFTLTPRGFEKCLKAGLISGLEKDLDKKLIADKGKANSIAKLLALVQATWFIFQCISRKVANLPITLLEIHVAIQVLYTWVSYCFWWSKPMDVGHPLRLAIDKTKLYDLGLDGYSMDVVEVSKPAKPKPKPTPQTSSLPPGQSTSSAEIKREPTVTGRPVQSSPPGQSTSSAETKGESIVTNKPVRHSLLRRLTSSLKTKEEAKLPVQIQDSKGSAPLLHYDVITEKPLLGILNLLLKCVYDILEHIVGEQYKRGPMITIGLFIISNGALHLLAWNVHFATTAERITWLASCGTIIVGAIAYIPIVATTEFEDYLLTAVWELRFEERRVFRGTLSRFKEDLKKIHVDGNKLKEGGLRAVFVFSWLMTLTYAFCILYITVESFIGLRSLPKGAYSTPQWGGDKYWPHFG